MDLKKILITGGAGYIGTPVVKKLLEKNLKIIIVDRFSFDEKSLSSFTDNKNIQIINCDIRDDKIISENLKGVDTVVHLAALVGEAACKVSEEDTKSINYDATLNLCKLSKQNSVKKFIFMSTASSYGVQDVKEIADENTKLNDFFTSNEVVFYNSLKDLSEKINFFKENKFKRNLIAKNGKDKYFRIFNNKIISDYICSRLFGKKPIKNLSWMK